MKILTIGVIIIVNLPNQFLMNFKMFLIIMMIFIMPQRRGIPSRFEKITPVRKQELKNTVEVRHTSSTARQGLSDPAAGISTLNGNTNLSQPEIKSSSQTNRLRMTVFSQWYRMVKLTALPTNEVSHKCFFTNMPYLSYRIVYNWTMGRINLNDLFCLDNLTGERKSAANLYLINLTN